MFNIVWNVHVCDPEINSGQAATLRVNVTMKVELSNERGKKSFIEILQPGSKKFSKKTAVSLPRFFLNVFEVY